MTGEEYEMYCVRKMRRRLWTFVRRVGKSGDFGADIVARGAFFTKIVVQCKHYSKPVGVKAVQEVYAAKKYYGASRAAVATNAVFTRAAKKLAKECKVELWEHY